MKTTILAMTITIVAACNTQHVPPQDLAHACADLAQAYCARAHECGHEPDVQACSRDVIDILKCKSVQCPAGTSYDAKRVQACITGMAKLECRYEEAGLNPPGCTTVCQ